MTQTARSLLVACSLLAVGCGDDPVHMPPPEAGPLLAGVAEVRQPIPVGIGTVGFAGFNVAAEPSPFAAIYAATTTVHGHPSWKAVVLSRGEGNEVVFLRGDLVGVFQQFRRAVVLEVEKRIGKKIDDALVMGGTHTHSGPGRILNAGGIFDLIADSFFPEHYQKMVDSAATAIVDAYADLKPARVGHTTAMCPGGHNDRRCEDGRDYTNDRATVVAVEREGKISALVLAYAVHGTVLGVNQLTLSADVSGAIEAYTEAGFDHHVPTLFFNSWAADMQPSSPKFTRDPSPEQPPGYDQLLAVGQIVASSVHAQLGAITWESTPELYAEVHRAPISREAIGYPDNVFPNKWGAVFCNAPGMTKEDCDPSTTVPDLDQDCVPFPEEQPAPMQTEISAGKIGTLSFVTFPGEAGTLLAEELLGRLSTRFGAADVAFFGYAQDYLGYSLQEADWWQGGYEASGALWGPKQGEYLIGRVERIYERAVASARGQGPEADAPAPVMASTAGTFVPYVATLGERVGTFNLDAAATYTTADIVNVKVLGNDPWLGTPTATLVRMDGSPVLDGAGMPITSDGYAFWTELVPTPGYKADPKAASRAFEWSISMPAALPVAGLVPSLTGGMYRLSVSLPTSAGPMKVESAPFSIGG